MSERDKGGYGRPPKDRRFEKGKSGNPAGRPPKPPPTWAQIIENEWKKPITLVNEEQKTALELMLLHVMNGVRAGDRRALRVQNKFEAAMKAKLRLADSQGKGGGEQRGRHKKYRPGPDEPLSEKERNYRKWKEKVEELLLPGVPLNLLSADAIKKLLYLYRNEPERPTSRDLWRKPKAKKLEDTEIFDLVLNSRVLLKEGARSRQLSRMAGIIRSLVIDAARGNLKCAETLIDLHRRSTKEGDFGTPKRSRK